MDGLWQTAGLWLPLVIAMGLLTLASAFFSGSETACFSLSRDDLRKFQWGTAPQRAVAELMRQPDRLLAAILFWNLLVNLTYFTVSLMLARQMAKAGSPVAAAVAGVGGLALIILLGEVLPKSLALSLGSRFIGVMVGPLWLATRAVDPVIPVLGAVARLMRRTIWPHIREEPTLELDDLERAVEVSHQSRELALHERHILHNVFDLNDLTAEDVMRPRGTYDTATAPVSLVQLNGRVPPGRYLFLVDRGSVNVDAAIPLDRPGLLNERHLERSAEAVIHVPWCASVADILSRLRRRFSSTANVVNEYGDTIGVVIYEDILTMILDPEPTLSRRATLHDHMFEESPGVYEVDGRTRLRLLCSRLRIDEDHAEEWTTVAGLLQEKLDRMPESGDLVVWQGYMFRVLSATRRGRLRAKVSACTGDGGETTVLHTQGVATPAPAAAVVERSPLAAPEGDRPHA